MEKEEKKVVDQPTKEPCQVMEDPQATIKHLVAEIEEMRTYIDKLTKDNVVLRATLKAVTQLL